MYDTAVSTKERHRPSPMDDQHHSFHALKHKG